MKQGDGLTTLVEKGLETTRLRREVKTLRASRSEPYSVDRIIGESPAMIQLKALLKKIAGSPASTVLLTGESGTGKDLAAKVIHFNGPRAERPFMSITCSALVETQLESELFGHERGTFTDAGQKKRGLLELADGGTVFLDEIGEMVPALQAKLLRFLEDKTFKRVGGSVDIQVDVCVIAATDQHLDEDVRAGKFREDLYYRLKVFPLYLPPLRDRTGDTPKLVAYYIDTFNRELKKQTRGVTSDAMHYLESHPWPGNIRELRNAVERAMLLSESDELTVADFTVATGAGGPVSQEFKLPPGGIRLDELERSLVEQALARAGGNQTRAAALLGLNRDQVRYRIEKFGLARPEPAS